MNPTLAAIYGLDIEKTASEQEEEELDLTQISGAELLDLLAEEPEIEKEAGDELDLTQISGAELLDIMSELEVEDDVDTIEKMAADGTFEYYDTAGRMMARAHMDELEKIASGEDEVYDLSEISAEDTLAMLESGEFELVDGEDFEKEAGARDAAKASFEGVRAQLAGLFRRGSKGGSPKPKFTGPGVPGDSTAARAAEMDAGPKQITKNTKGNIKARLKEMATGHQAAEGRTKARMKGMDPDRVSYDARARKMKSIRRQERAKGYAARGLPAAGVGAGGVMLARKKSGR